MLFSLTFLILSAGVAVVRAQQTKMCQPMSTGSNGGIELFSKNFRLEYADGTEFKLKGLNWFGFETNLYVVHGLWAQSVDYFLDFLTEHKFNALRIPLSVDVVSENPKPPNYDYLSCFFDGQISSLEALDYLIARLAERGILVLLDQHRLDDSSISECYTDNSHDEDMIITFWDKLIARYGNSWNVMGVDLKNEPYGCEWRDWVNFATRMGDHILDNVPRWLIFVNGVGEMVDQADRDCVTCSEGTFWGENLMGACNYPPILSNMEKLVYSPHVYGPSVYGQDYFDDITFPANMPDIWDCHFGFLHNSASSEINEFDNAVVIGEWGGEYTDSKRKKDKTWQDSYKQWHRDNQLPGTFYWCLNKNSGDTGGLLTGQKWQTPETEKLSLLDLLQPDPTAITSNSTQYCYQDWSTLETQTYDPWPCSPGEVTASPTSSPGSGSCDPKGADCGNCCNGCQTKGANANKCK